MAQLCVRLEDDLKTAAEELFEKMGLTLSSAINVFLRQSVNRQELPFVVSATTKSADIYWGEINRRIADVEAGHNLSEHELLDTESRHA